MFEIYDFLPDYLSFREYCDHLNYDGVTNPADGVFYPGVSVSIPFSIQDQVQQGLEDLEGPVSIKYLFLRLSLKGMEAPHQAHSDRIMGRKSMMLYMSRPEHCQGGTSFLRHESGMENHPQNDEEMAIWEKDMNSPEKWEIINMCEMFPNKACIFDASMMHRAEPIGGFGESNHDGRLVLTAFYD